jgi:hypothetical protein
VTVSCPGSMFCRKWLGVCILADYTCNSSTSRVLYQERLCSKAVFSKGKSNSTPTGTFCKRESGFLREGRS